MSLGSQGVAPLRWCSALQCVLGFSAIRWLTLLLVIAIANVAIAQPRGRNPHLAYMYPAGCERGMTCEVTVGGQHLKDVTEVYVSGEGITAEIIGWYPALAPVS